MTLLPGNDTIPKNTRLDMLAFPPKGKAFLRWETWEKA